jgi:FG-GAP repeat
MRRTPYRSPLRPLERLEDRSTPAVALFATGVASGAPPRVNVYSLDTATSFHQVASFLAYPAGFSGGVTVATADLNGDGITDVVTGAGPGGGPHVEVWDGALLLKGQATLLKQFFAYDPHFTGGVFVAAANAGYLSGNGFLPAIITGAGAGGGPHVRVFDYATLAVVRQFYAYDPHFAGGVRVAAGQGAGFVETGAGPGGGPHVKLYDDTGALFFQFYAFDPSFTGGVFLATGGFATGALHGRIGDTAVTPGPGGPQEVRIFDALFKNPTPQAEVTPYPGFGGGFTATVTQDNHDFNQFLLTAPGPLGGPDVRVFENGDFKPTLRFNAYDPSFLGGVFVG